MKKKFLLLTIILSFLLCACGNSYSEDDLEEARRQAYNEGYNDGYSRGSDDQWVADCEEFLNDGYSRGSDDQWVADCEEFLIDGRSIRNIQEQVYEEYRMTPHEAFSVIDEYEYDYTHGGYTWDEYQEALEVMYYTMSIFPYDY